MVWARLDDAILDNPKIAMAGAIGFAMHVAGITYCCRNVLTNKEDGLIPESAVRRLLDLHGLVSDAMSYSGACVAESDACAGHPSAIRIAERLVACGLWEKRENGYKIHDYEKYNPTKAEVEEQARKKSESGKKGAASRWIAPAMAVAMAPAMGNAKQALWQIDGSAMAKVCPDPDPDPDPLREIPPSSPTATTPPALAVGGPCLFPDSGFSIPDKSGSPQQSSMSGDKPKRTPEPRGTRCPDPDDEDAASFCTKNKLPPPSTSEMVEFMGYWSTIPGARGRKTNWLRTLTNRRAELAHKASSRNYGASARQPRAPDDAEWRNKKPPEKYTDDDDGIPF